MSKRGSRLSRLGVLAPAALSACIDASVLAAPAAGAILSTVLKELSKAFMLKNWFHGVMSATEAEQLLMLKGRHGSYLVRESHAQPGEYVISVRVCARVAHVNIRRQQNKYDVGSGELFDDLTGLIEHCHAYPLTEPSGEVLRLRQPVSGARPRTKHIQDKPTKKPAVRTPEADRKEPIYSMEPQFGKVIEDLKMKADYKADIQSYEDPPDDFEQSFAKYWKELTYLKEHDDATELTKIEGKKDENKYKNRYRDIIPFDQTRVHLPKNSSSVDEGSTDYINASYIRPPWMFKSIKHWTDGTEEPLVVKHNADLNDKFYIAAQGCLAATRHSFWAMIADNDVRVIAMLTKCYEDGKNKCDAYWPPVGKTQTIKDIKVTHVCEYFHPNYITRQFLLETGGGKRTTIYQYHFTEWPDRSAPSDADAILRYLEAVNHRMKSVAREETAPKHNIMCVHCSAGVGRTGALIAIDILIDIAKIESGMNLDTKIQFVVKVLRQQRPAMVQNEAQYKFVYQALKNYLASLDSDKVKLKAEAI